MSGADAHYPHAAPVTAYGNGGFRFADMSHRGSILCLPSGVYGWSVARIEDLTIDDLSRPLAELHAPAVLLIGTGLSQAWPQESVVKALIEAKIGFEFMSTGAAARTYNVLLAEGRGVGAALIAVD